MGERSTERLTPGEQAIWAAVFAAQMAPLFQPGGVPLHVLQANEETAWKERQAVSAAEVAWATVEQFRTIGQPIEDSFGRGDVLDMWRTMRGY